MNWVNLRAFQLWSVQAMLHPIFLTVLLTAAGVATAENASAPDPNELVTKNTHVFSFNESTLKGPGIDFLRTQVAKSQFVLVGENHNDHATPIFAGSLYRMLHSDFGFHHLVVEQDPVAIQSAVAPDIRGKVERIAALSKKYPSLFEFDSDEDLTLLAFVGRIENDEDAIWGVEQATGAVRYLEELDSIAPNTIARDKARALLDAALAADPEPKYSVNWLVAASTPANIAALSDAFHAKPDSLAARLLGDLAKSSEIFNYYRRAEAGEFVGLYNNTVREEVLKTNFLRRYRAASRHGALPKAMFKFGSNHLYHGRSSSQAFPIGNLAHELAIFNGSQAYGIYVAALGENYASYKDSPDWMRPLLPAAEPTEPIVVDLRALRPYQRLFREKVAIADQWQLRDLINGYDAIVLLPGSRPASRTLGGR